MTVATHGVGANSADRLLKGAGVVYLYYYDTDSPGTLLGATQGGNTVTVERKFRDVRCDGALGPVKGLRRLESIDVRLEVNLLECTAESIRRALAGSAYSSGSTQVTAEATATGNAAQTDFDLGFLVEDCEDAWDAGPVTGVTSTLDTEVFVTGSGSAKFSIADNFSGNGRIGYESTSLLGNTMDDYQALAVNIRSSIAIASNKLGIVFGLGSALVTVYLPAIPAATWMHFVIPTSFAPLTGLTIYAVSLVAFSDFGACVINVDTIKAVHGPIEENSETITVGGAAVVRGVDYTMDYDQGRIQFYAAPANGAAIVATYKYVGGGVMAGAEIDATTGSGDYIECVALLVNLTGYTNPAILKIKNVLVTGPFGLDAKPASEAVQKVTFTGHYAVADLATEPWEITYPAS
jgi:hypothetical protein